MNLYRNNLTLGSIPQLDVLPGTFNPLSISGCSVWLDASQVTGADGLAITSFPDLSGNTRHFNGNGTLKTNIINGKNVVRLTSSQTLSNSTNFGRPITIFYVMKQSDTLTGRLLSGVANNWLLGHHDVMKDAFYAEGWVSPSSGRAAKDTNFHIWIGGQSASTCYMWDGLTSLNLPTPTAGTQGPNGLAFTGHQGTSEKTNGDLAELLVYNSLLSDSDRINVTNYLKAKYNL